MTIRGISLRDLARFIPLLHDFVDKFDCEISPEDWQIEDGKLILDLRRIKEKS